MHLFSFNNLVKDTMSKEFIVLNEEWDIRNSVEIMLEKNHQEVFVVNSRDELIGILSLTDVSKIMSRKNQKYTLGEVAVRNLATVSKEDTLEHCRNIMIEKSIGRLPVVDNGKLIGVIREREIRDYFYMGKELVTKELNLIINNIQEAVCAIDDKGEVLLWNESAEKLYNVEADKIIGSNLKKFFPDAIMLEMLKTKKPISNKYHSPVENSYVVISAVPIIINGEFLGVVSSERDVSEVRKLSEELNKANKTLQFLKDEVEKYSNENFGNIIGRDSTLSKQIHIARQVANRDASVLITGESGTGKEVFSRAIHDQSGRKGLFVPVNCSAIPSGLFESEFFGYEEGAFTGANKKGKVGVVELANNGTLFLDEIGDMPMFMQAKLLRLLQEKEFRRVGGTKDIKVDIRIVSATNKDLKKMVDEEKFREDLFYRLNVVEIELPPLRERKEDIAILIYHFLNEVCKKYEMDIPLIKEEVISILESYSWEGNIRELKNTVERLVIMNKGDIITKEVIPEYIFSKIKNGDEVKDYPLDLNEAKKRVEIDTIKKALEMSQGNKADAAKILNIPRTTLYYKLEIYNLN